MPLLIQNPSQRVSDGWICRRHVPCLARQLVALVKLAQIFRVKIRQIVQRDAIFRSQDQQLLVGVAGVFIILLRAIGHGHEQQCAGILRVLGQCCLKIGYCFLVLIVAGVELSKHQISQLGIGLQLDGL